MKVAPGAGLAKRVRAARYPASIAPATSPTASSGGRNRGWCSVMSSCVPTNNISVAVLAEK
jgi:hypothetical protein